MNAPLTDRRTVEAAIVSLQECLANGDPTNAALLSQGEAVLLALRAAYRDHKAAFSKEAIDALREISELLHESGPATHAVTPGK